MRTYIIEPLTGVSPIRLGMNRDEVRRLMDDPPKPFRKSRNDKHETDAFHQNAFQVFYADELARTEYIEISRCNHLRVLFRDLSIFETPADVLLNALGRFHDFECDESPSPCDVIFPDLEMSLWRPHPPSSSSDENGRYFSTVGIGILGYYA
jgi:hypothetical protein